MSILSRCRQFRRRILEVSQKVPALHIGGAFSCLEILETIYYHLPKGTFILSKGHAGIAQYVILEDLGLLSMDDYGKTLGVHPSYGTPGIEATTGSLGHGLGIGVGIAYADRTKPVYVVISDGECMEGSTWEAVMMAANLNLSNLICFVDNNDMQSASRSSVNHHALYPISEKFKAFGWWPTDVDGHDSEVLRLVGPATKPLSVVCKTVKGKGVSFMENNPIWHYRSPNKTEYEQAMKELS